MGASDAEKGGLLTLTYASPPEWDCPPPGRWAIRSALFPATKKVTGLQVILLLNADNLIFTEIHTPTPVNQIRKVEKLNN